MGITPTEDERRAIEALGRGPDARSTDLPSGRGIPPWMESWWAYCGRCGAELRHGPAPDEDRDRHVCATCGHIAYVNPRLVVTVLPVTDAGEVVLLRRGIEPGRGSWAQPGGFLEIDESVAEAAVREAHEETGLIVEPTAIVGLYSRLEAAIVVVGFEGRIVGGEARTNREALEIRTFAPQAIPWEGIAFKTTHFLVRDWLARHHPDVAQPADDPREQWWG